MRKLRWTLVAPIAACLVLALTWHRSLGWLLLAIVAAALIAAVFAAVHHAEVVAHRVGEPYGTLILALAITVIEVALIVSLMLSGGPGASELARDTLFATVMIVCNGVVGLCLLAGSLRHHVLEFRALRSPPPDRSTRLRSSPFAGVMSLALYAVMVFVQTVRHRDYFLPVCVAGEEHAPPPSASAAVTSLIMLVLSLIAVIGLAKMLSPGIRAAVDAVSAPPAVVGIVVALLVLLPETTAAVRAALRNRMQTSLNLALGSALASIGLFRPSPRSRSHRPAARARPGRQGNNTACGDAPNQHHHARHRRATVLQGAVHLVLFAAFLFLSVVP